MNLKSSPNEKSSNAPESAYAAWGCCAGIFLGLLFTVLAGGWLTNGAIGAVVGFLIGALIDRSRK